MSVDGNRGYRHDKAATPLLYEMQLLYDFVFQIPGEYDDIVRLRILNPVWMVDRNVTAWKVSSLLIRAAINSVFNQVWSNARVIQKCGAFAGSAVSRHRLAFPSSLDEKFQ